jgi:serine/threonine protein kinase
MSIDWIFGEYKILKKIATGGMAEVFLAKRVGVKGFEKLLAIKRILPQFAENEEFISMFIDEAKLAAQLNHRNIVQIYDFGNQQGSYYIAMEYVFGKDLRTILKKSRERQKRLPLTQCAYIIAEAARGLEYAHNTKDHYGNPFNIIHRDISPQNIFVSYEGDVKIADFGIAKAASKSTETRAGVLKGKILYMSPEQAWGKTIDKRSDLYSLGVLFYEMVTDRKIVEADSEFSMLEKVRNAEVEFPPEIFEKIPKRLSYIIKKALEKDPGNRYQSAHEMRIDLENLLLSTKETLSEKMISDYLKDLFKEEIEGERKILIEGGDVPVEKTISMEPISETKTQEPEKIFIEKRDLEKIEPLEKKGIPQSIKEAFRTGDVRMKVGLILILMILGVVVSFYLFTDKSSITTTTTSPTERRVASSPPVALTPPVEVVVEQPKEKPKATEKKPSSSPPSKEGKAPSSSKETASPPEETKSSRLPDKETEPKTPENPIKESKLQEKREVTPFPLLMDQGPTLLRENKYLKLLEDIEKLSNNERQNINIKILESFAHLKKWVLLKDKNSKTLWGNFYNALEHSGDRTATPILMKIAKDPEEWTRLYAVNLLGSIGDQRALNDLQEIASKDTNRRIRRNASNAISLIQKRG